MDKKPGFIANIIAAVGFFFILLIILWALINITRWAPALFDAVGGLFGGGNNVSEILTISTNPSSIENGNTVAVSWDHNANKGSYAFTYACTSGSSIQVPTAASTFTTLPCESAYVVSASEAHSIQIKALTSASSVTIPVFVTYRDEENIAGASDSTSITVTNSSVGSSSSGGSSTSSSGGSSSSSSSSSSSGSGSSSSSGGYTGNPDLSVSLLGFGVIVNNTFTPTSQINPSDTAAIKFKVANTGTNYSGAWRFRASLPANPTYIYESVAQQSLEPGAYIEYTLRFTNPAPNGGQISVQVDPQNAVAESNEINNNLNYNVSVYNY